MTTVSYFVCGSATQLFPPPFFPLSSSSLFLLILPHEEQNVFQVLAQQRIFYLSEVELQQAAAPRPQQPCSHPFSVVRVLAGAPRTGTIFLYSLPVTVIDYTDTVAK